VHPVPLPFWPFRPLLLEIQKYPVIPPGTALKIASAAPAACLITCITSLLSQHGDIILGTPLFPYSLAAVHLQSIYLISILHLSYSLSIFPYISSLPLFTLCFHDLSDDLDDLTTSRLHHLYCLPTKVLPRRYRPDRHRFLRLGPYPAARSFDLSYDACSLHTPVFISHVSRSSRFVSSQAAETVSSNKSAWHGANVWPVFDGIEGRH
jgi:hypothetical protein